MGRAVTLGIESMRLVEMAAEAYDVVLIGTGFGTTFFLHRYLKHAAPTARILVLERGKLNTHADQIDMGAASDIQAMETINHRAPAHRAWNFTVGFGGGSNCWWGNAVRQHPSDFKLKSTYGVGRDWPIDYDDIEPYYCDAEEIMQISGPSEKMPYYRSRPFPLPPHILPLPDQIMKKAQPDHHFVISTARPSRDTATRPKCCVNGVCHLCPIDSKFTVLNSFTSPYEDPRVDLLLSAEARLVDIQGGIAKGVDYRHADQDKSVKADLVILAANAIFNPVVLQRSGLDHPQLGRNLHDQYAFFGEVFLDGVDHFQGSTLVNGLNYSRYDGDFRRAEASVLLETWNVGGLRSEAGRWRQVIPINLKIEDLPQEKNRVALNNLEDDVPDVIWDGYSPYALKTLARVEEIVRDMLAPLPVESVRKSPAESAGTHIHGTTIMGRNPEDSILDGDQIHHQVRNLVVLGSSAFPSGNQSNPTLTICAIAMKTADKLGHSI